MLIKKVKACLFFVDGAHDTVVPYPVKQLD